MASAVLASGNDSYWGERKVYMRKYSNTTTTTGSAAANNSNNNVNNKPLFMPKSKPNPAPNPSLNKQIPAHNLSSSVHSKEEIPSLAVPSDFPVKEASRAGHVTFNPGAYTRQELKELKKRLLSELEQVRVLRIRIENTEFESVQIVHPPDPLKPNSNRTPKGKKQRRGTKRANPFSKSGQKSTQEKRPDMDSLMRSCRQILMKLMKHKYGWVFNAPVDVVSLRLHDYNDIIKKPMDLGTVKRNLENNQYNTVLDFAADVRLTFNNALKYNPKGHDVYLMAEILLGKFEKMLNPVVRKVAEISVTKASSTNKVREMSFEEKTALGRSLVELPQEMMDQMLSIVKKKNGEVCEDGDEIEVDIEAIDNETLWELDGFVSNYKRKKQVVVEREDGVDQIEKLRESAESEMVEVGGEEEVDIGEEIPVENFPPVEIERDVSSSGSDSSSSSGSDSGSSSGIGSESDDDSLQSPFVEGKDANGP